ncbi:MAG: IS5 family transposase [Candidatus Korobacteraceae bacterium]
MSIRFQPGFFDIDERTAKLTEMGDPLVGLKEQIDWEAFRPSLNVVYEKPRKSNAGAKPIDVVLMFKILVLQQLNNLSDDRIEYQIRDRLSFMRFLGLQLESRVPDAKTVWLFRERLKELNLVDELFAKFHEQLARRGYVARAGQMIDATFVEVPRQRNTREENAGIKSGKPPEEWDKKPTKRRQKDVDARWTKKNQEKHYGYKNHINADQANKLVQSYAVSDAAVHDSQVFEELLDQAIDTDGKKRPIYGDSAYRSKEREETLDANEFESQIHEKGTRGHPLTEEQKASNRIKSKTRARVEHIFGAQHAMGGHIVRTIGLARAKVKIGMMNLVFNMKRLVQLIKRDVRAANLHYATSGEVCPQ